MEKDKEEHILVKEAVIGSIDDMMKRIRRAVKDKFDNDFGQDNFFTHVFATFPKHVIVERDSKFFKLTYKDDGKIVTLGDPKEVEHIQTFKAIKEAEQQMTESVKTDLVIPIDILEASVIDKEKGIYEITLIKEGLTSDKRRIYPRSVLEASVSLFEGTQAYADHPTKTEMKDRPERSIRDLIGDYTSVRLDESNGVTSIKAQLNTLESAEWVRPLLTRATESSNLCGASIHADGTVIPKGRDGVDLVESIKSVFSTDIVTRPNAGGAIERLIASERDEGGEEEMKIDELTIKELTEKNPELLETFKKEVLEAAKKEEDEKITDNKEGDSIDAKEFEALRESNESMKIELKIKGSKILEAVKDAENRKKVDEDLTASLKGKTDEEMDTIIESRKVFLKSVGVKVTGNPPKENTKEATHTIGALLPEAKAAYGSLQETKH